MLGEKPCFNSVCGISLWKFVIFLGFCQLGITLIGSSYISYKMSKGDDRKLNITVLVLDFMIGAGWPSFLLILGAKPNQEKRRHYLIILMVITVISCIIDVILLVLIIRNNEWEWDSSDLKVDIIIKNMILIPILLPAVGLDYHPDLHHVRHDYRLLSGQEEQDAPQTPFSNLQAMTQ